MGLYARHVLPRLLDAACGSGPVRRQREKVVPMAEGRVLEIGIGSGLNLPHYELAKVSAVVGLEPAAEMAERAEARARDFALPIEVLRAPGEDIPLPTASVDTVLVTYTLCTIPDARAALAEMRRVLHPDGRLIFCEHGRAPDRAVRRWQDRLDPLWGRLAGGCHLNRDIPLLIAGAGFTLGPFQTMYLPGTPRVAGFNTWGWATPS